jgi:hypothetical protein
MTPSVDPNEMANIIDGMIKASSDRIANRTFKRGIISAINGQYCDVLIEGNPVATEKIVCLASYIPHVGDTVLILSVGTSGSNLLVLGAIYTTANRHTTNNSQTTRLVAGQATLGTGAWVLSNLSGFSGGTEAWFNNSNAIGDYVEFTTWLAAGTYKTTMYAISTPAESMTTCTIDGATHYTVDLYAASNASLVLNSSGISIPQSGLHTWRYTVTGKNAASTAYRQRIISLVITKTGA